MCYVYDLSKLQYNKIISSTYKELILGSSTGQVYETEGGMKSKLNCWINLGVYLETDKRV